MFERVEIAQPSHKAATLVAFLINSSMVVVAILIPLLRPDRLPSLLTMAHITVPYSAPRPHVDLVPTTGASHAHVFNNTAMLIYNGFRPHPATTPDEAVEPVGPFVPGAPPSPTGVRPTANGFPWGDSLNPPPAHVEPAAPRPTIYKISHLDPGALLHRVQPVYPAMAKSLHQQGTVVLTALIDTRGQIVGLQAVSGPPLLIQAAMDAVKQWRYRPYLLNGEPIEVQTEVTVNFVLQ